MALTELYRSLPAKRYRREGRETNAASTSFRARNDLPMMAKEPPQISEWINQGGTIANAVRVRAADVTVVAAMAAVYAFSFFQRIAVPGTVFDELQRGFALSSASVTLLGGLYLYIYSALQLPAGALIDRFGGVKVILAAGALMTAGAVLFPLSRSVCALYSARALVGIGASAAYLCVVKEVDVRFSERRFPAILGMVCFAGYTGGLMGTYPFQRAVEACGWRGALLTAGIASGSAVLLVALLSRTAPTARRAPSASSLATLGEVIRNRASIPATAAGSIVFGAYFVVQAIVGKKLISDCCGVSSAAASGYTFLMMLTTMCCVGFVGYIPSLIGFRRRPVQITGSILATLASGAAVLCLTYRADSHWLLGCYLAMSVASTSNVIFVCSIKELNPPCAAATAVGVLNTACYLGIAIMATLVGAILDQFRSAAVVTKSAISYPPEAYRAVFLLLFGLSLASVVLSSLIRETRGQNSWHEKPAS